MLMKSTAGSTIKSSPIQFHQHSASNGTDEIRPICKGDFCQINAPFAKRCLPFAQFVRRKKLLILFSLKNVKNFILFGQPHFKFQTPKSIIAFPRCVFDPY